MTVSPTNNPIWSSACADRSIRATSSTATTNRLSDHSQEARRARTHATWLTNQRRHEAGDDRVSTFGRTQRDEHIRARPTPSEVAKKVTEMIDGLDQAATYSPLYVERWGPRFQKVESGMMKVMFPGTWSWEVYDQAWDMLNENLDDFEREVLTVRIRFPDGL